MNRLLDQVVVHPDWKRWLLVIVGGTIAVIAVINAATGTGSDVPDTAEDRAPYAEVACEDFARDTGAPIDDGETSNFTTGVHAIYTVQLYTDRVRVGTCVVQATGADKWTLVKLIGP